MRSQDFTVEQKQLMQHLQTCSEANPDTSIVYPISVIIHEIREHPLLSSCTKPWTICDINMIFIQLRAKLQTNKTAMSSQNRPTFLFCYLHSDYSATGMKVNNVKIPEAQN